MNRVDPAPYRWRTLAKLPEYQGALRALGEGSPGGYVHGRTAAQWLIDAEILEDIEIDPARMRVNKFMARSTEWEAVKRHRGWFRYLPQSRPEHNPEATLRDNGTVRNG